MPDSSSISVSFSYANRTFTQRGNAIYEGEGPAIARKDSVTEVFNRPLFTSEDFFDDQNKAIFSIDSGLGVEDEIDLIEDAIEDLKKLNAPQDDRFLIGSIADIFDGTNTLRDQIDRVRQFDAGPTFIAAAAAAANKSDAKKVFSDTYKVELAKVYAQLFGTTLETQ